VLHVRRHRLCAAALAGEHCLANAVLLGCIPAGFAAVGGVPGIHVDHHASSFFRFGTQDRHELGPARVVNASVQPGLGGGAVVQERVWPVGVGTGCRSPDHVLDRQVLDDQQVVACNQQVGGVVVEVAPLVGDLAIPCCHRLPGRAPVIRAPLFPGEDRLGDGQLAFGGAPVARIGYMLAGRGGGEAGDPHVDTGSLSGWLQGPSRHVVAGQHQHPPPPFTAHLNRLEPALRPAVHGDLHVPDALQVDAAGLGVPPAAVTVFGPLHRIEPVSRLESRVAGRVAGLDPPEERGERPVQAPQRRLLGRERPHSDIGSDLADILELSRLVPVGDALSVQTPGVMAFLEGSVVQLPVRRQAPSQSHMLAGGGPHPELVGPSHATLSRWSWMYWRTRQRASQPNSAGRTRDEGPLKLCATSAGHSTGRVRTKTCTWSRIISRPRRPHPTARSTGRPPDRLGLGAGTGSPHPLGNLGQPIPPRIRRKPVSAMTRRSYPQGATLTKVFFEPTAPAPIVLTVEAASPLGMF
jgi:hypothetical protein